MDNVLFVVTVYFDTPMNCNLSNYEDICRYYSVYDGKYIIERTCKREIVKQRIEYGADMNRNENEEYE